MQEKTYTIQEVGARARARKPEAFTDFTDEQIGQRLVERNPELQSLIAPVQEEKKGLFPLVSKGIATAGAAFEGIGKTIGALPGGIDEQERAGIQDALTRERRTGLGISRPAGIDEQGNEKKFGGQVADVIGTGLGVGSVLTPGAIGTQLTAKGAGLGTKMLGSALASSAGSALPTLGQGVSEQKPFGEIAKQTAGQAAIGFGAGAALPLAGALAMKTPAFARAVSRGVKQAPEAFTGTAKRASDVASDIIPSRQELISKNVTKALDLTQGDAKNVLSSTGNEVGEFMARNNLLGGNKQETMSLLDNFFTKNYQEVRDAIAQVPKVYATNDVPVYREALSLIQDTIKDTPGLKNELAEVVELLGKEEVSLTEIQRAKELVDEYFDLYKLAGDPAAGTAKKGVRNFRQELRELLEKEVREATNIDIRELNNNVQTARAISDAAKSRTTRGFTRSNMSLGDFGAFTAGSAAGLGNPLIGVAAVLFKRITESPAMRLRFAKWLKSLGPEDIARVTKTFSEGGVPKDIPEEIIQGFKNKGQSTPR